MVVAVENIRRDPFQDHSEVEHTRICPQTGYGVCGGRGRREESRI